jgi:hypothetical protein
MPDAFARSLSQIDGELRSLRTLDLDAGQQLSSIREEQARLRRQLDVLIGHELFIEGNIEARRSKSDRLLDERLRSQASDQMPSGVM